VYITVGEENVQLFELGVLACIEAHCIASPTLLDWTGPSKKRILGRVLSLTVLLEFVRLILIDELPDD
jgi:hypothetical protein